MFEISAVIATYNRAGYLVRALHSLVLQTLDADKFEVIVVDNNCTDNTKKVCEKFHKDNPHINYKYFLETNQGLSYARNRGIEESSGKYITFVDDDAHLHPEFLSQSVNFLERNHEVYAIGGKILLDYETEIPRWVSPYLTSLFGYFNIGDEEKSFQKFNFPRGSNMTFRMDVFEKVGIFNPELGRNKGGLGAGEEKDLFDRIYSFGLKVHYVPTAIVYHYVPESRTKIDFIRKQALNTGKSERIRVRGNFNNTLKRTFQEFWKWGASTFLFFIYLLKMKPSKGQMLIKFRFWVSKGYFIHSSKNN